MVSERGIYAPAYALVHAGATSFDRERHAAFLAHMLLLAFAALAVAPLFLAFHGAPTPAESLLFALSLASAGAAILVARTGRLVLGHLVASAGLAGVAIVLFLGMRAGPGAAIPWLVAAYLEAVASFDRRLSRIGAVVVGAALVATIGLSFDPRFASAVSPASAALLAGVALLAAAPAASRMANVARRADGAKAARQAQDSAIDALSGAVVLNLDASGCVLSLAKPESSFLAAPDHVILGRGLLDRVLVADRPTFLKLIDDAACGPRTVEGTFRMRVTDSEADGHSPEAPLYAKVEMRARRITASSEPTAADAGGVVAAMLTDVTGRDRQEQDVAEAQRAVEEALRAKDQFLTTMSHELHTPLNAIIGFSEILASRTARPADVARQCELARIINQSGQHLLATVDTILDLSRIQSGTFPIQPEPFDAAALLDQSAGAVAAKAREASLRLVRDYPAALEEMVGDRRALKLALVALLSNAVKFTPAGGQVTLAARPEGNALVVTVADTGIGIAPENLVRLGDPFFQASGSISRSFDGSGLGLALVRGLVGLHGGTIAIESAVGRGTRVTIKLPLDCRSVPADPAAAIATLVPPSSRQHPSLPIKDAA